MSIKQRYEAYRAECSRNNEGNHGAVLREMTEREQSLYDDWQQAIKDCATWRDEGTGTTWHILSRFQDGDLEMLTCRIITPDNPQGEISACYAYAVREMA